MMFALISTSRYIFSLARFSLLDLFVALVREISSLFLLADHFYVCASIA
jgi:hypothetical protein